MWVTLHAFFAGSHREIDWHNVDSDHAIEQLQTMDTLTFLRVTYQIFACYWRPLRRLMMNK